MSLAELKNLELHDMPLAGLCFDFEMRTILVKVSIYNGATSDYDLISLHFSEVEKIHMSDINIIALPDLEVYSHDVSDELNKRLITFTMLTGFGRPDFILSFEFNICTIHR